MFTGIIEETGLVKKIEQEKQSLKLTVEVSVCARGLKIGDSLAVNGCCLTVSKIASKAKRKLLEFDLLQETWERTNLKSSAIGSLVNLERALPANGRLGGHFVTGHVDGTGKIVGWKRAGSDRALDIQAPPAIMRYVVSKGSIAVDGISLTVAALQKKS